MNKIWLLFISTMMMLVALIASASIFSDGVQYQTLDRPITDEKQVIEFFSFYCPHCYQFEHTYHISQAVAKILPAGTKMLRYHVEFLGPLGKELTQAWSVAMVLGIEDKISPLLFDAVQKTQIITTSEDIRNLFIKVGVDGAEYDSALNSFVVKSLVLQQAKSAENFKLRGVPAMFVNGKYMIKSEALDMKSMDSYAKQYADLVSFLINKK